MLQKLIADSVKVRVSLTQGQKFSINQSHRQEDRGTLTSLDLPEHTQFIFERYLVFGLRHISCKLDILLLEGVKFCLHSIYFL